eukprot:gene21222-28134_t
MAPEIIAAPIKMNPGENKENPSSGLGTMDYMAPEIIAAPIKMNPGENKENPSSGYTFKVDCWSAGVLAFEVLTGRAPFSDYPPGQFPDIKKFEFPSELSEGAIDFLSKVLVTDPEKRPTIPEKFEFPSELSDGAKAFISKVLETNPELRPTIPEMLSHPWIQKFKDPRALVNWKPPPSPPRRRYQTMSGKTADKELDSVLDPETRRLPFSSEPGTGTGKYEDLQQGQDEGEKKNPTKEHGSPKSRMEKPVPVPAPSTLENMHGQKQGAKGDPVAGAVKNGQGGEHGAKPENPVDVKADTPKIRQGGEKYAELPPIPMSDSFTLESGEEQNAEDRPSVVTGPRTPKKDRSRVECFEERMSAPVSPLNSRGINKVWKRQRSPVAASCAVWKQQRSPVAASCAVWKQQRSPVAASCAVWKREIISGCRLVTTCAVDSFDSFDYLDSFDTFGPFDTLDSFGRQLPFDSFESFDSFDTFGPFDTLDSFGRSLEA